MDSERRLALLAEILETPLSDLESFLDFLAEEDLTPTRISKAQQVLGLPTPILSYIPYSVKWSSPSCGKELLDEWRSRQAPTTKASRQEMRRLRMLDLAGGIVERFLEHRSHEFPYSSSPAAVKGAQKKKTS